MLDKLTFIRVLFMDRRIIARKVKEARERCEINQTELAKRLGWKSHTSIVAIEQGEKDLKMWELLKLAEVLHVSPEFLYSEEVLENKPLPQILWRQRGCDTEAVRKEEELIRKYCDNFRLLERLVAQQNRCSRRLPQEEFDIQAVDFNWAVRLADNIYKELDLGDYPAEVLARRLEEDFGVIMISRPLDNGSAACFRSADDIVIVTNEKEVPWRRVFSLAHDLFHIVTWNDSLLENVKNDDLLFQKNERLADAFAAALLMPQQMIERDMDGMKLTYSFLVALARKYRVSTSAILWRLCGLRFLSREVVESTLADDEFTALDRSTYKDAYKSSLSFGCRFLRLAYLALESGRLSRSRLARMLGINLRELDRYLSTNGFELTNDKEIVTDHT